MCLGDRVRGGKMIVFTLRSVDSDLKVVSQGLENPYLPHP